MPSTMHPAPLHTKSKWWIWPIETFLSPLGIHHHLGRQNRDFSGRWKRAWALTNNSYPCQLWTQNQTFGGYSKKWPSLNQQHLQLNWSWHYPLPWLHLLCHSTQLGTSRGNNSLRNRPLPSDSIHRQKICSEREPRHLHNQSQHLPPIKKHLCFIAAESGQPTEPPHSHSHMKKRDQDTQEKSQSKRDAKNKACSKSRAQSKSKGWDTEKDKNKAGQNTDKVAKQWQRVPGLRRKTRSLSALRSTSGIELSSLPEVSQTKTPRCEVPLSSTMMPSGTLPKY